MTGFGSGNSGLKRSMPSRAGLAPRAVRSLGLVTLSHVDHNCGVVASYYW